MGGEVGEAALRELVAVTRDSRQCGDYAKMLGILFHQLLTAPAPSGPDEAAKVLRSAVEEVAQKYLWLDVKGAIARRQGTDPMSACYLEMSFPSLLHFAHKYAESPAEALLASANAGGENVHRGCVLGALLGAAHGGTKAHTETAMSQREHVVAGATASQSEVPIANPSRKTIKASAAAAADANDIVSAASEVSNNEPSGDEETEIVSVSHGGLPAWMIDELLDRKEISKEVDAFVAALA